MRKHNGMRPHDVAILLKIIALCNTNWNLVSLSGSLYISISEISESLNRSQIAGLIDFEKKKVSSQNLLEFIEHGLRYVYPQKPGALLRGLPTAVSHPFMKKQFKSEQNFIWPDVKGSVVGQSLEPLYPKQILAAKEDPVFYKLMALVDVIRIGRAREIKFAATELRKLIINE